MASKRVLDFEDGDFLKACEELDAKNVDEQEWEFFLASHDVEIYRHYNKVSGLYSYKVYGYLKDVLPDICAQVYMDLDYRKQWDSYVKDLYEVTGQEVSEAEKVIYWRVAYPWPMSHRDYVYSRELRTLQHHNQTKYVVLAKSVDCVKVPEKHGLIRVTDYLQSCALTSDGGTGSKAFMHYYDDPRGMIPTWVINWAAKTGVPHFLSQMQTACRGYPEYLRQKESGI